MSNTRGNASKGKKTDGATPEDTATCEMCSITLTSSSEALACDRCHIYWACAPCLGIQSKVYKALHHNPHMIWLCENCKQAGGAIPKTHKAPSTDQADIPNMLSVMMAQLQRMENKLDQKADSVDLKRLTHRVEALELGQQQSIDIDQGPQDNTIKVDLKEQIDRAIEDYREREARKLNLIIFNLEEAENEEINERKREDKDKVIEVMKEIGIEIEPTNVLRLGAKSQDNKRPIKVELRSVGEKWKIITGAKKLKDSPFQHVGIALDLSKKQREERQKLKQELDNRKQQGETNIAIKNGRIINTKNNKEVNTTAPIIEGRKDSDAATDLEEGLATALPPPENYIIPNTSTIAS